MIEFKLIRKNRNYSILSLNKIFSMIILILYMNKFVYNIEACINNEAYMKLNKCVSICNEKEIFIDKICYPISLNETDIKNMYEIIKSYIKNKSINDIRKEIIIKGEGIIYQITTNKLIQSESISNNSIKLNLGEECLKIVNEELKIDYYIILINIINSNYTSSTKGIKIFIENIDFDINLLCGGKTISLEIPVKIPKEILINYEKLINKYNYDILNLNDLFYIDICKIYTSEDKTDMTLSKRISFFGSHAISPCAENCKYNNFDIKTNKIFCSCYLEAGEEINEEKRNIGQQIYDKIAEFLDLINFDVMFCIKLVFSNKVNKIYSNYGFMIMTIIIFLFILCMIITCFIFRQKIIYIVSNFKNLKMKFRNIYHEEINKIDNENNKANFENIKKENNENNKEINIPPSLNKENILILNGKNEEEDEEDEEEEEEEEEDDDEEEEEEDDEEEENEKLDKKKDKKDNEKTNEDNEKNGDKNGKFEDKNEDENNKKEIIFPKEEEKKIFEVPNNKNELSDSNILSPRILERDSINISNPSLSQQKYLDYNKYIQDYNNYINYIQYYNNYINNYINSLNYFNNINNNNYNNNFNISPQNLNQPSQNDSHKPTDMGLFQLIIPYDKIKDKIKEKKNKDQIKINRTNKKNKKTKNRNNIINNVENVQYKKKKKQRKKNDKKNIEKEPKQFKINLLDVLKPNPPKNNKIININNINELQNSPKVDLKKDNYIESKKDDNSVYNLSDNQNNRNRQNKKNYRDGIILYNQNLKNKNDLISQKDNTKIKENDEKISELSSQEEEEMIFGSEEFYKSLMNIPQEKRMEFFIDEELNSLEYQYAIKIDKRSFCKVYFSFLKKQNIFIFCLSYCCNDYNLSIMKISLLLFQISLFIIINAFFFTDNTLNYIYEKKNKFDLSFMIKQLGLAFIICYGINIIFKILVRSDSRIIEIKLANKNLLDGIKCLKYKFIIYYILSLMIIFFGWFYISCFCAVFYNTQIILLKCALYSLASTFVYPFFICLISSSIRICSLKDEKMDKRCLYGFSKILSYI